MINVVPIFSTPIYLHAINITEDEKNFCKSLPKSEGYHHKFNLSNDPHVINHPQMARIRAEAMEHFNTYVTDVLAINQDHFEFVINTSWSIDMSHESLVQAHIHTHSLFTAVIVLDCSKDSKIVFSLDRAPLVSPYFDLLYDRYNTFNSRTWFFNLQPKQIYIFPSALLHHAVCEEKGGWLDVLAFDTFIKGTIGDHVSKITFK